tara:strand:+ start:112 stop:633 length:522 start_codon:yes stop_codon:yes gene_type:complete
MSKIDQRYKKGQIYCVRCRYDDNLIYVGSTINMLSKRFWGHKRNKECSLYQCVNGDWDNWYIELYEDYSCNNKAELDKREGEITREIGTVNKNIAGRNKKEYYNENKVVILEKKQKYRDDNRDKIRETNKIQDAKRSDYLKEKVECENCKSIVSRHHLLNHTRSNKCISKLKY